MELWISWQAFYFMFLFDLFLAVKVLDVRLSLRVRAWESIGLFSKANVLFAMPTRNGILSRFEVLVTSWQVFLLLLLLLLLLTCFRQCLV